MLESPGRERSRGDTRARRRGRGHGSGAETFRRHGSAPPSGPHQPRRAPTSSRRRSSPSSRAVPRDGIRSSSISPASSTSAARDSACSCSARKQAQGPGRHAGRRGPGVRREGDLRDQQVHRGLRRVSRGARGARPHLADGARGSRGRLSPAPSDARPVLGHPRLASRRAHDSATSRRSSSPRWSRRRAGASTRRDQARAFVERELDFPVSHTFGGNSSCVELETGGRRLRPVRPWQRRARLRQPRARHARADRGIASTSSCPTCTGITSWASRSSCPRTSRATTSASTDVTRCSRMPSDRQNAAPSFPVDFSRIGRRGSSSCASTPAATTRSRACGSGPSCSATRATRTAIGSSRTARRWSTRPTPSTSCDDPAVTQGFVDFFAPPTSSSSTPCTPLADAISVKEDWGHSSNIVGVELCQLARAKHLCMFHHEPIFDDEKIFDVLAGDAAPRRDHARRAPRPDLGGLGRDGDRRLKVP